MDAVKGFLHDWRLVLLIIHVGITASMIIVILLQRSEGGGLGMGARTDALFSVRGQANVLSRMTAIFAGIFFFLSLLMAWSVGGSVQSNRSFMDSAPAGTAAPAPPTGTTPAAPAAPATPALPSAPNR
jgi:preprotein translocase subunit SecG